MMMFKTWHWSAAGTASTGASLWQQNWVKCSCGPMVTNIHLCFEAADSERSKPWAAELGGLQGRWCGDGEGFVLNGNKVVLKEEQGLRVWAGGREANFLGQA